MFGYKKRPKTNAEYRKELIEKQIMQEESLNLYPDKDRDLTDDWDSYKALNNRKHKQMIDRDLKLKFNESVMETLVESTIYNGLVYPVLKEQFANTHEKELAVNLIENYIHDNGGAFAVHESFHNASCYLEDWYDMINKYYTIIMEQTKDKIKESLPESDAYAIEDDTIKSFLIDSSKSIPNDITKMIADRVEDSVNDFIDKNKKQKFEIKKVYDKAKEKIAALEPTLPDDNKIPGDASELDGKTSMDSNMNPDDKESTTAYSNESWYTRDFTKKALHEEAMRMVKAAERKAMSAPCNLFDAMTRIMLESVHKLPVLRESYSVGVNNRIDFQKVINDTKVMYTMLECFNTLGIMKFDEETVQQILSDMKQSIAETGTTNTVGSTPTATGGDTSSTKSPSSVTATPPTNKKPTSTASGNATSTLKSSAPVQFTGSFD